MPEKFVVKPLNELVPEDVSKVYDRVDVWLKQTTGNLIGLDEVSVILKTLPITGNLFAIVDNIRDFYHN